jgi:hypothetical protein
MVYIALRGDDNSGKIFLAPYTYIYYFDTTELYQIPALKKKILCFKGEENTCLSVCLAW